MSHEVLQPEWKAGATLDAPIRNEDGGSFWFPVGVGLIVDDQLVYRDIEPELIHVATRTPEAGSVCGADGKVAIDSSHVTCLRCRVLGDPELMGCLDDAVRMLHAVVPGDATTAARFDAELGMLLGTLRLRLGTALRSTRRPESSP